MAAGAIDQNRVQSIWEKKMKVKELAEHVKQLDQMQQNLKVNFSTQLKSGWSEEPRKNQCGKCRGQYKEGHLEVCTTKNRNLELKGKSVASSMSAG